MSMRGANIDTLTDFPSDIIEQVNDLHGANCKFIRYAFVNNPRDMSKWSVDQYVWWFRNRMYVLDGVIPTLIANGQPTILDPFQHPPGGFKDGEWQFFKRPDCIALHYQLLEEVVEKYKDNDAIFAFEPINEPFPKSQAQLQAFYNKCCDIIRAKTDKHIVLNHSRADCDQMRYMKPVQRHNIWYSYHFYKPLAVLNKKGDKFTPTKAKIKKDLKYVLAFEAKYRQHLIDTNSKMLCGEFGCMAASGQGKNQEPWVRLVSEVLNELGHDWLWLQTSHYDPTFKISDEQFNNLWR